MTNPDAGEEQELRAITMEEVADDLLCLERLVRQLAAGQDELRALVQSAAVQLQEMKAQHAMELRNLRRDLLEEGRAQVGRNAFDAIHPALDYMDLVRTAAAPAGGEWARQISAVQSALRMVLRGLGFTPFTVEVGAPFDPARMEVVDYADGERDTVLAVVRPGYEADGVVVRPCGVDIADPTAAASPEPETDDGTHATVTSSDGTETGAAEINTEDER